jgi:hypothetical protein
VTGGNDLLKAGAQRRAQLAKKAEPKENLGLVGSVLKGICSVTNRIGVTGSTTRVIGMTFTCDQKFYPKLTLFT